MDRLWKHKISEWIQTNIRIEQDFMKCSKKRAFSILFWAHKVLLYNSEVSALYAQIANVENRELSSSSTFLITSFLCSKLALADNIWLRDGFFRGQVLLLYGCVVSYLYVGSSSQQLQPTSVIEDFGVSHQFFNQHVYPAPTAHCFRKPFYKYTQGRQALLQNL